MFAVLKRLHIFSASLLIQFVARRRKDAGNNMLPKTAKYCHEKQSHRAVSSLSIISKSFEKILLNRMKLVISNHLLGFRC